MAENETEEPLLAEAQEAQPSRRQLLAEIWPLWFPMMVSDVTMLLNEFVNTVCLGQVGDSQQLAAVGLGNMMQNCCALTIGMGLTSALDTFVSQASGAGEHSLCTQYLQRSRLVTAAQLVWMIPLLWSTDPILLALGFSPPGFLIHLFLPLGKYSATRKHTTATSSQHEGVSRCAAAYNRAAVFGLFGNFQYQVIVSYLQNMEMPLPPWVSTATSLLHVAWAILFVVVFQWGNMGAGAANALTWTLQWLIGSAFLVSRASELHATPRQLLLVQKEAFRQWSSYMEVALPATVQVCSELWFWEICALVMGYLGPTPLAAHVAAMNLVTVLAMPTMSLGMAAATVVGTALGAQLTKKARDASWFCVSMCIVVWSALALLLLALRSIIPRLLASDLEVQSLVQKLLMIYVLAGYADSAQNVMGSTLRGVGRQTTAVVIYLVSFYAVMLPLGCVLAWPFDFGLQGMWYSMVFGTSLAAAAFFMILHQLDWEQCACESDERRQADGLLDGTDQ
eukprot:s735_g9.t2